MIGILGILSVVAMIIILSLYISLLVVVGERASDLGRSGAFWVMLAILTTPIIVLPLLHCAGETKVHRLQRIEEEEYYRSRGNIRGHVESQKVVYPERYMPKD